MVRSADQEEPKQAENAESFTARIVLRLREEYGGRPTPDGRERIMMQLMSRGLWVGGGQTVEDIAPIFGVTVATLAREAATASRRIRDIGRPDTEAMRARLLCQLESAIAMAAGQKDPATMIKGLVAIRDTFGLSAAVQVSVRADPLHGMSDDELRRIAGLTSDDDPSDSD